MTIFYEVDPSVNFISVLFYVSMKLSFQSSCQRDILILHQSSDTNTKISNKNKNAESTEKS